MERNQKVERELHGLLEDTVPVTAANPKALELTDAAEQIDKSAAMCVEHLKGLSEGFRELLAGPLTAPERDAINRYVEAAAKIEQDVIPFRTAFQFLRKAVAV